LATFQIPVFVNYSTNSDGTSCTFGMPPYHSEIGGYQFDEVLDCEVPAYSKQGIWCGVTSFATSNCTGPPILQRYDMQIGSCDEELKEPIGKYFPRTGPTFGNSQSKTSKENHFHSHWNYFAGSSKNAGTRAAGLSALCRRCRHPRCRTCC
jgi:hypothetical protein